MNDENKISTLRLIYHCGGYRQAVDAVATFGRIIWELAFTADQKPVKKRFRVVERALLFERMQESVACPSPEVTRNVTELILQMLESARPSLCQPAEDGELLLDVSSLQPMELGRKLLKDAKPDHELRYFIMRNIRNHYQCFLSSPTVHLLHVLSNTVNALCASHSAKDEKKGETVEKLHPHWSYSEELRPKLYQAIVSDSVYKESATQALPCEGSPERIIQLFIECCRAVGYFRAHKHGESIKMRTASIDFEYLISNIFGIPSMISGFNQLFGGGGLLLTETQIGGNDTRKRLDGRTVLITGRFGTGKSLMGLQLAIDVARKGGVSWVMSLEQTSEEYLYTSESMNAFPNDGTVIIATDAHSVNQALKEKSDKGLIIILNSLKDSYEDFLHELIENNEQIQHYPLRLIVVDPINSVSKKDKDDIIELRARTLEVIDQVQRTGTNLLLVAEDDPGANKALSFEEKIADTVIRLSIENRYHYAQRYFEITKSRLQREQRGEHPFSIVPGAGVTIFPSTASVHARIRSRGFRLKRSPIDFGLEDLDYVLGKRKAILGGDVIVFSGPEGALKRETGLLFLLGSDEQRELNPTIQPRPLSLLVAARDDEFSYRYILEKPFIRYHAANKSGHTGYTKPLDENAVRICSLPSGHVNSGYILQRLDNEFSKARAEGFWIDRVMVDSVNHWEISCPFIRDDETFGDTLIDYLRRYGVTSLLICGDSSKYNQSVVQKSIISHADCLIQFNRFEVLGKHQVTFRILKTRGMGHRRDLFDISLIRQASEISITPSLLRIAPNGEIKHVKVSLFLHSETDAQKDLYNNLIVERIRAMLSPDAEIERQNRAFITSKANLSYSSIVDELQIYHLDEFQLPDQNESSNKDFPLHIFPESKWPEEWEGKFIKRLAQRVRTKDKGFFGVPYYTNISFLAYDEDLLRKEGGERILLSWRSIAKACEKWEKRHPNPKALFFEFPKMAAENYNCLFWEILLGLNPSLEETVGMGSCHLRQWLQSDAAIESCRIYRTLCRRAYLADAKSAEVRSHQTATLTEPIDVNPDAIIWRHWYSTLNQMMTKIELERQQRIKVTHLPCKKTVAGEWFCAVPVHSAAPEVGLEIIKLLVRSEDDLERQQIGIGLPTREAFYKHDSAPDGLTIPISPYFSVEAKLLQELISNPFKRSDFKCYPQLFPTLAHYLRKIIEIPDGPESSINKQIKQYLISFGNTIESVRTEWTCSKCYKPPKDRPRRRDRSLSTNIKDDS